MHIDNSVFELDISPEEKRSLLEKFNRLLESMQKENCNRREESALVQLKELVAGFSKFMEKRNEDLNESERRELQVITGARFELIVKKRMAEDFIHRVKYRVEKKKNIEKEERKLTKEISELKKSFWGIVDWIKLTIFAFEYDTITIFSHNLKKKNLSFIQSEVSIWIFSIRKIIGSILDKNYYLFSNLEYNSLEKLLSAEKAVLSFSNIKSQSEYSASDISNEMEKLCEIYVAVIKHSEIIEKGIKKIRKGLKKEHGLWGYVKLFLGEPIKNIKKIHLSRYDEMTKTILGVLLSYYTVKEKVVVRSLNQISYLANYAGEIKDDKKYLTKYASEIAETKKNQERSETENVSARLNELDSIINVLISGGKYFEETMLKFEMGSQYEKAIEAHNENPLLRIKRLVAGYIKYFIEDMSKKNNFILVYDGKPFNDFFSKHDSITNLIESYNMNEFELIGKKSKDFTGLINKSDISSELIINHLTNNKSSTGFKNSEMKFAGKIIANISEKSYRLGNHLFKLISFYKTQKGVIDDHIINNYDFFCNAQLYRSKYIRSPVVFIKESITFQEFIEAACSISFFIASELNYSGMKAMEKERELLHLELQNSDRIDESGEIFLGEIIDINDDDFILDELNRIFVDTLTGLKKKEYLEDVLFDKLYDDFGNAVVNEERFLFLIKIINLPEYNKTYGRDFSDEIVLNVSRIIKKNIIGDSESEGNIVIRYSGQEFLGYIIGQDEEMVDRLLNNIFLTVNNTIISYQDESITGILLAMAFYEEKNESKFESNLKVVEKLLSEKE